MLKASTGIVAVVVLLAFILTCGWVNIAPTDVAVEVNKVAGKVSPDVKGVGYHFFNRWITDMVTYKVAARAFPSQVKEGRGGNKAYTLQLKTNDGQNIDVDLTIIYALVAKHVPALHQDIGMNFEDQVLLPQIRSEARIAIGSFSAEEIYQGNVRSEIQETMKTKLASSLQKYPAIQVQDTLIRNFEFSGEFEKAIERKKLAAQEVEINRNRALAQEQEATRQEAEARGLKLKAIQAAQGRAESMKVEADAKKYQLEQEAAGNLAIYKADAEGKRLQAEALGGGENVVALKFAETIPDKLEIWGVPTGQNNTSLLDVSGVFGKMMMGKKE